MDTAAPKSGKIKHLAFINGHNSYSFGTVSSDPLAIVLLRLPILCSAELYVHH